MLKGLNIDICGTPPFQSEPEASVKGPVYKGAYDDLKLLLKCTVNRADLFLEACKNDNINKSADLDEGTKRMPGDAETGLAHMSTDDLCEQTRSENPWCGAMEGNVISHESMVLWFKDENRNGFLKRMKVFFLVKKCECANKRCLCVCLSLSTCQHASFHK